MKPHPLLGALGLAALSGLSGCDGRAKGRPDTTRPDTVQADSGAASKLDAAQERRVAELDKSGPLLNPSLAEALIGLPKDHAERIVQQAYPKAVVAKNNPRVNVLFAVQGAGKLKTVDVRWSRMDKRQIGSVVFTYGAGVDVPTLGGLVKAVSQPIEGEKERWTVQGGRLVLSFFPSNMEGETVVAFEPAELEGDAIDDSAAWGKQLEEWGVAGRQRDKHLKAAAPRTDEFASGRDHDERTPKPASDAPSDAPDTADPLVKPAAADSAEGAAKPVADPGAEPAKKPAARPGAEPAEDPLKGLDDI